MDRDELRALQAPLKQRYRDDPGSALVTLRAEGKLGESLGCSVPAGGRSADAGLHPAAGGSGLAACSGDMLLESLVACFGVTLSAVATVLGIKVQGGTIVAEGDLDFRGTLGVAPDAPVGFTEIRLRVSLNPGLTQDEQAKFLELTKKYCVVYQTLRNSPNIATTL
jgi:uncharacterized OsmC-like protein